MFRQITTRGTIVLGMLLSFIVTNATVKAQTSLGTNPDCTNPPTSILVYVVNYWSEWPGATEPFYYQPAFEDYVFGVVMGELHSAYAGAPWSTESIKAQAVAARTYGSYKCYGNYQPLPDGRLGVRDGVTHQVYRPYCCGSDPFPTAERNRFFNVSRETSNTYATWDGVQIASPYKGVIFDAQYRDDNAEPESCGWRSGDNRLACQYNGPVYGYEYLPKVNNPYDDPSTAPHGPGYAQRDAELWMRADTEDPDWPQLLQQYYYGSYMQSDPPDYASISENFYNTLDCSGPAAWSGTTRSINYDWGTGSPKPGVNSDNFCGLWTGWVNFPYSDWYTFYVIADDGFCVYLDTYKLLLDEWHPQTPTPYSVSIYLTAGVHKVDMYYYEATLGAVARLSWSRGVGMIGSYYDAVIPKTGTPADPVFMVRPDVPVKLDWSIYSPLDTREAGVTRIFEDTFSVIWRGRIYPFECRTYYFYTRTDDGAYLKITHSGGVDETLIDHWQDQGPTWWGGSRYLCPGIYPVEFRYYENGGGSVAWTWWTW